jgi:uncharacterized membrane protein YgcG
MDKRKVSIGVIAVLLIGIGAAWALGYFHRTDPAVAELQQLGAQMRTASETDRPALFEQFRQKMDGLTDAQREEFRQNNQGRFRQDMSKRMNEFFAMSPADQKKRLDEIIDQMQKRQAQRQAGGGANGGPGGPGGGFGFGGGGPGGGGRGGGRQNMTDGQREQGRKSRLDNTNPAERAQQDKFRAMLGDRMQQRGMSPPTGGGRG